MDIPDENIIIEKDLTYEKMKALMADIKSKYMLAHTQSVYRILCFIWYGGHGEMFDGSVSTQVVLNGANQEERRFDLE